MNRQIKSALDEALKEVLAMPSDEFIKELREISSQTKNEPVEKESWKVNQDISTAPRLCFEPLTWIEGEHYNQRRIVSAANKYELTDGRVIVVPCVRHSSRELHANLDLLKEVGLLESGHCKPSNQGFIDQYCNWWSREDAFIIAKGANQINLERNSSHDELYSEGLY